MIEVESVSVADLERDPYPIYRELRAMAPAVYMPCLDVWMIVRYAGVDEASKNPSGFPAHVERSPTDRALGGVSMMTTDGEPAKQRRRPFDSTFRPRAVEARMPEVFDRISFELLDQLESRDVADLVTDFFEPLSLLTLAHALEIDDVVDVATLRRWFSGLAAGVSNYEDDPAKTAQCDSVSAEIENALAPKFEAGGSLAHLIQGADAPAEDPVSWIMPSLKLVLLGGLQEPAHGGATVAYCLLANPDQLAMVHGRPELVSDAVEEGLRWTAPIGNLLRGINAGATVERMALPEGERAIIVVSSANHDESAFGGDADVFDLTRKGPQHMSFATGPHYCIGHHFARVQLRTAIARLFERFPDISLDPDREVVFWGHEYRSPTELHVNLH